ncbi:dehydrogenase, partial [Oryctes borbonicus]
VHGCLLALHEYIPKYKIANEGAIINLSSTAGLGAYPNIPVYAATKHAILGLTRSWGHEKHFAETKVRVMAICPNATGTPLLETMPGKNLGSRYEEFFQQSVSNNEFKIQSTDSVAKCIIHMLNSAKSASVWLVDNGEYCELKLPDIEAM